MNLVSSADAAQRLGIDRSTLTRWVASGRLKIATRLPPPRGALLFHEEDIARLESEARDLAESA